MGTIGVFLPHMEQTQQLVPQLHIVMLIRREKRMLKHNVYALQILDQYKGYEKDLLRNQ